MPDYLRPGYFSSPLSLVNQSPVGGQPGLAPAASTAPSTAPWETNLATLGFWASVGAAGLQATGAFYSAKSQKMQAESMALDAEYEASIAGVEARAAEFDAQQVLQDARREAGQVSMAAGQRRGAARASAAARGVVVGVGSSAEQLASIELARQADVNTISANGVRGAEAQRRRRTDALNRASMARVSADNARASGRSISTGLALGGSLLSSVGTLSNAWVQNRRWSRYSSQN